MSKADEILQENQNAYSYLTSENEQAIKQALYTDLLELIGEDISLPQNKLMETEDIPKFYANKLRQELRDKLKEYFGDK